MTERLRRIATRMRQELGAIERLAVRAARAMELARQRSTEQDFYLDSVALSLHDIYTGLERVFQQIAAGVDEDVPSGEAWHEALLRQMAAERPPRRPAVITEATRDALDNFLRFRHVVRNVYAFEFDGKAIGAPRSGRMMRSRRWDTVFTGRTSMKTSFNVIRRC